MAFAVLRQRHLTRACSRRAAAFGLWLFSGVRAALAAEARPLARRRGALVSDHLYIIAASANSIVDVLAGTSVDGYDVWHSGGWVIRQPGAQEVPAVKLFYARNYYRVLVAESAVEFRRESNIPPELLVAERQILETALSANGITRWVVTLEDYDDNDRPTFDVVAEGATSVSLRKRLEELGDWAAQSESAG
jgi:hypothetical protein